MRYDAEDAKMLMSYYGKRRRGFSFKDVAKGMNIEREHKDVTRDDPRKTMLIALAHLHERPDYYDLLEKLERAPKRKRRSR